MRLILITEEGAALVAETAPFFRIYGSTVWVRPQQGSIARFTGRHWQYQGLRYSGMRFAGRCHLVFGPSSDPQGVSVPLHSVVIAGGELYANGIPLAVYELSKDMWHGAAANTWWHAFRLESASLWEPAKSGGSADVIHIPDTTVDLGHTRPLS